MPPSTLPSVLAQGAEPLPLALMRPRQLEVHGTAPWWDNTPLHSSGRHLAFFLLGKDTFLATFVKNLSQHLGIHPMLSTPCSPPLICSGLSLCSPNSTHCIIALPSLQAIISLPSSGTCSGSHLPVHPHTLLQESPGVP